MINYGNLYTKTYYFEDPRVEVYSKIRGWLKKKKDFSYRAQIGFNKSSKATYFCFFDYGQIFAYFKEEPKDVSSILNIIYVSQIENIEENKDKQTNHFKIFLREKKENQEAQCIHVKCENDHDRKQWIKGLQFFQQYYKDSLRSKNVDDDLDVETQIRIAAEIEINNWNKIKDKFNHKNFIEEKGLNDIFENKDFQLLKNRFLISSIQKETKKRKGNLIQEPQTPITPFSPQLMKDKFTLNKLNLKGSHYYMILISQRPIIKIDEEYLQNDTIFMKSEKFPQWLEFNKIYFLEYSQEGDISPPKKTLDLFEIERVQLDKQGFSITIQLKDKFYIIHFKYSWEVIMWYEGIRNAIDLAYQLKRSRFKVLKYDITRIYDFYNQQKDENILKEIFKITNDLQIDVTCKTFLKQLSEVSISLELFSDCFYSYRPMFLFLYQFCATKFHESIRIKINSFWLKKYQTLKTFEVQDFIEGMNKYMIILDRWGLIDDHLKYISVPLLNTFLAKFNQVSNQILTNTLCEFKNEFFNDQQQIVTKTSLRIQTHLQEIFENYDKNPTIQTAKILVENCGIWLFNFFKYAKKITLEENLQYEVQIGILNNSYQRTLKNFMRMVYKKTNNQISLRECKNQIKEQYLIQQILQIEQILFQKVKINLLNIFNNLLVLPSDNPFNHDFVDVCRQILEKFNFELHKISNEIYQKEILNECFILFPDLFLEYFKNLISFITQSNYSSIQKILEEVTKYFQQLLKDCEIFPQVASKIIHNLDSFYQFFILDDLDMVQVYLLNIIEINPKKFNYQNIKLILKAKIFFPKESIDFLLEEFTNQDITEFDTLQKISQIQPVQSQPFMNLNVILFINKLKMAVQKRRNDNERLTIPLSTQKQQLTQKNTQNLANLSEISKMKGWAGLMKFVYNEGMDIENKIKGILSQQNQFKKRFFLFSTGSLNISKDSTGKTIYKHILYNQITKIDMLSQSSFYLTYKKKGVVLFFKDFNQSNAKVFFDYLCIMQKKFIEKKIKISLLDMTYNLDVLDWPYQKVNYKYDFDPKTQKDMSSKKIVEMDFSSEDDN